MAPARSNSRNRDWEEEKFQSAILPKAASATRIFGRSLTPRKNNKIRRLHACHGIHNFFKHFLYNARVEKVFSLLSPLLTLLFVIGMAGCIIVIPLVAL